MTALSIAVIAGGPSTEAAVSRKSAESVRGALTEAGHRATVLELDRTLPAALLSGGYDLAFPVTHGALGEDGCLQGLLEVLDVPYVGSGVLASALAASKPESKLAFAARQLPVLPSRVVTRGDDLEAAAGVLRRELGAALVVKPAEGGSSIGLTRVPEAAGDGVLRAALATALELDRRALVEPLIVGLELTCSVLEDERGVARALPATLIRSKAAEYYDFKSKYAKGGSEHVCPAPLSTEVAKRIAELAERAHRAVGARDLSRVDFILEREDDVRAIWLLEVNTLPGFTGTSLFPEAAAAHGIGFVALCDALAQRALARPRRSAPPVMEMP